VRAFTSLPAHRPISSNTLPSGWVSVKCEECGSRYEGVNDFEARKTLAWHMMAQHGLESPSQTAIVGQPAVVLLGQIVVDDPMPGRRLYFAKCPMCDARFESINAEEAHSMRQEHLPLLHRSNKGLRAVAGKGTLRGELRHVHIERNVSQLKNPGGPCVQCRHIRTT
jgi:hypothetical protein